MLRYLVESDWRFRSIAEKLLQKGWILIFQKHRDEDFSVVRLKL